MIDPAWSHRTHRVPLHRTGDGHVTPAVCSHGPVHSWSVVVPAKRLAVAKTRLRPVTEGTSGVAHQELVLALLADTVSAATACPSVGAVLVVTDDPAAAAVARALGAVPVGDEPDNGLNPALAHGARQAGGTAVAALSSDLPALRPAELERALAAAATSGPRCFVPDAHGTGTTLLTAVGTHLAPRFGPGSAAAHRASGGGGGGGGGRPPGGGGPRRCPARGPAWSVTSTPEPTCGPWRRWAWARAPRPCSNDWPPPTPGPETARAAR
jgi:2-phospho-L-lactate guanylyltransferase